MIKNKIRNAGNAITTCALCFHVLCKKLFIVISPFSVRFAFLYIYRRNASLPFTAVLLIYLILCTTRQIVCLISNYKCFTELPSKTTPGTTICSVIVDFGFSMRLMSFSAASLPSLPVSWIMVVIFGSKCLAILNPS